jgi:hypothetical protein
MAASAASREHVGMAIDTADIIEAIIDELVMGDLGENVPDIHVTRTGPGSLSLDYGSEGRFTLTVEAVPAAH